MSHERIQELKTRISEAREAYYNLDPQISDQEYDALVDELGRLAPGAEEVVAVGAPAPTNTVWEKVRHEIPMGSLGKANTQTEFEEWASKLEASSWFITHKIDGSSMELVYQAGNLVRCVTRGDGMIGEDVFINVSRIPSVPKKLPVPVDVIVRGEVVMTKAMFAAKYASEYANPRNTAAGKVREKKGGGQACEDLEFMAYWMKQGNPADQPQTMHIAFIWLKNHGFKTPNAAASSELANVKTFFNQLVATRDEVPYEIDGAVISVNSLRLMEELGDLNMRPRGQIAWKFDAAMGETRMKDIKWQVGPSGRITPVAVVEPVEIGGVTITNISLHNMSMFNELKLSHGCRILVSRRNDVIPYIERNLDQ